MEWIKLLFLAGTAIFLVHHFGLLKWETVPSARQWTLAGATVFRPCLPGNDLLYSFRAGSSIW